MILEIASVDIKPGFEHRFREAAQYAADALSRAKGCHGFEVYSSVEVPRRYHILTRWERIENHMVDFRGSPEAEEWRRLARPCFDGTPVIDHAELAVPGF